MPLIQTIMNLLPKLQQLAPVALRLALGVVFIAHGADKLWGSFGGGGFEATVEQFTELGLKPAWFHATMGGYGELLGGVSVLLGLGTRLGGLLIAGTMVVAIITVHLQNGLLARDGGFEYPLVALAGAVSLVCSGGGWASVDYLINKLFISKIGVEPTNNV